MESKNIREAAIIDYYEAKNKLSAAFCWDPYTVDLINNGIANKIPLEYLVLFKTPNIDSEVRDVMYMAMKEHLSIIQIEDIMTADNKTEAELIMNYHLLKNKITMRMTED